MARGCAKSYRAETIYIQFPKSESPPRMTGTGQIDRAKGNYYFNAFTNGWPMEPAGS